MGRKVYVGNLSYDTDENEIREVFGADGREITEVALPTDRETGRPRGFGFVTFASDGDAQAAISALNGTMLGGRSIKVNEAQERSGGGGGRRGGGRRDRY